MTEAKPNPKPTRLDGGTEGSRCQTRPPRAASRFRYRFVSILLKSDSLHCIISVRSKTWFL
jgi:hypothetical protein